MGLSLAGQEAHHHGVITLLLIGSWDLCFVWVQSCFLILQELWNLLSILHSRMMWMPNLTADKTGAKALGRIYPRTPSLDVSISQTSTLLPMALHSHKLVHAYTHTHIQGSNVRRVRAHTMLQVGCQTASWLRQADAMRSSSPGNERAAGPRPLGTREQTSFCWQWGERVKSLG